VASLLTHERARALVGALLHLSISLAALMWNGIGGETTATEFPGSLRDGFPLPPKMGACCALFFARS
jgi:hypothetical protein